MTTGKYVFAICTVFYASGVRAQEVPIPPRPLGYVHAYGQTTNLTAVQIDAFLDPLCPDSKQAFPTLLQVANHYGPDVLTLRLHMFPLPYHRNSYLASMVNTKATTYTIYVTEFHKKNTSNAFDICILD